MSPLVCEAAPVAANLLAPCPSTAGSKSQARYLPEAVANFVALLGWSPGTEQEVFSMAELIQQVRKRKISLDRPWMARADSPFLSSCSVTCSGAAV